MATAQGLRDVFGRMGFGDKDIVALSGAHALGRCPAEASGYEGPWTPTPTSFNNLYFSLLSNLQWTENAKAKKFQYQGMEKQALIVVAISFLCLVFVMLIAGRSYTGFLLPPPKSLGVWRFELGTLEVRK